MGVTVQTVFPHLKGDLNLLQLTSGWETLRTRWCTCLGYGVLELKLNLIFRSVLQVSRREEEEEEARL